LQSADRGQLNTAHSAIQTLDLAQCWTLDPTGNWSHYRQDDNGDGTWDLIQDRTANTVNEITDIDNLSGTPWATPAYDKNGNSTSIPRPDLGSGASMTATYDAWNRMTKLVDNSTSSTLLKNEFDGRNFRIVAKQYSGGTLSDTRHYYFTDNWQCVEERLGSARTPGRQHVWGLRYIDDLIVRDRDTNADGTLDERLHHCADANWNTVAVVDSGGSVAERYEYDPYGQLSFFAADYTARSTSSYNTRYTYTNREWTPDAAIYYFRNRWYSPQLGRFCSRDPIAYAGGLSLYRLRFILSRVDPTGLRSFDPDWIGSPGCYDYCRGAGYSENDCYYFCFENNSLPGDWESLPPDRHGEPREPSHYPPIWIVEQRPVAVNAEEFRTWKPEGYEDQDDDRKCNCILSVPGDNGAIERPAGVLQAISPPGYGNASCMIGESVLATYKGVCQPIGRDEGCCDGERGGCIVTVLWHCMRQGSINNWVRRDFPGDCT
uniref:RHS repeat-associated core domain-containing protein n=1 Tax=Roseimaritima sediminicola TaxID=2662066 RepID=UPI0013874E22